MAELGISIEQFIHWTSSRRGLSTHTTRAYDGDLAAFRRLLGGELDVRAISAEDIDAFVESQRQGGLSDATVARRVAALRGFMHWLVVNGVTQQNPLSDTKIKVRKPRRLPRSVPATELRQLVSVLRLSAELADEPPVPDEPLARPHQATTLLAVGLMIATGVRVGEVVTIQCSSLDIAGRSIRIHGKGSRERTVYFPAGWLQPIIEVLLVTRTRLKLNHDFLLFKRDGSPMTTSALRGRLATAGTAAGLKRVVTPHMLRHSAATELLESGVDIRYVQRLLGHASITTTEIYTHVSDVALRRVINDANVLERFSRP